MIEKLYLMRDELFEIASVTELSSGTRHLCDRAALVLDFVASILEGSEPLIIFTWRSQLSDWWRQRRFATA